MYSMSIDMLSSTNFLLDSVLWNKRKQEKIKYVSYLDTMGSLVVDRVERCGEVFKTPKGSSVWFCKNRLCPLCACLNYTKNYNSVSKLIDVVKTRYEKLDFMFFKISLDSIPFGSLGANVVALQEMFNRVYTYKRVAAVFKGFIRFTTIECDHESKSYNISLNAFVLVPKDYSNRTTYKRYITRDEWLCYCDKAWNCISKRSVDFSSFKFKRLRKNMNIGNMFEPFILSKDYLTGNYGTDLLVINECSSALKNFRLLGFGGIFKTLRHEIYLE